jgi:hypothetical protein
VTPMHRFLMLAAVWLIASGIVLEVADGMLELVLLIGIAAAFFAASSRIKRA